MVFAGTGVWKSKRGTPLLTCRRVFINDEQYGYNIRDELIAADEVSYAHDDIGLHAPTSVSVVGNRTTAEGKTNTANNLNQYTAIDDFAPQYDADGIHAPTSMSEVGNQTLIKTETGIWSVSYNAENRPIRWQSGDTVITMVFDRMGRRGEMRTVKDGEETLQRFVYDNYLCILQLRGADNALFHSYVWDPTEPIATRPLIFIPSGGEVSYYFHDGNKNVSDLVDTQGNIVHYDYVSFGAPTASAPSESPYRFSSEVYDDGLGLVYYNYRHFSSDKGRWLSRDLEELLSDFNLYNFLSNNGICQVDVLGRANFSDFNVNIDTPYFKLADGTRVSAGNGFSGLLTEYVMAASPSLLGKILGSGLGALYSAITALELSIPSSIYTPALSVGVDATYKAKWQDGDGCWWCKENGQFKGTPCPISSVHGQGCPIRSVYAFGQREYTLDAIKCAIENLFYEIKSFADNPHGGKRCE